MAGKPIPIEKIMENNPYNNMFITGDAGKDPSGHRLVYCTCLLCGKENVPVRLDHLRSKNKHTVSCGCHKQSHCRELGLINSGIVKPGYISGYLTVLYDTGKINKGREKIWMCRCKCGNLREVPTGKLQMQTTTSCGCIKKSYGAKKCEELLINIFGEQSIKTEVSFEDLKDIKPLRFDIMVTRENKPSFLVEYDGEQHRICKENYFGGKSGYNTIQKHDKMKNEYCIKNNIILIRIPDTLKVKDITLEDLVPETSKYLVKPN